MILPFPEPERVKRELDEDLVYSYLVGEIGAHRGELRLSQTHYQHAAILAAVVAGDEQLAETRASDHIGIAASALAEAYGASPDSLLAPAESAAS